MVLRGLFDAEGSVNIENKIEFANNNPKIRKLFMKLCPDLTIFTKTIGKTKNKIRILGGIKGKSKFYNEVGITILRKRKRLEKHLNYYKNQIEKYKIVMKLRNEGLSAKKIKEKFRKEKIRISKNTIESWMYKKIKPLGL